MALQRVSLKSFLGAARAALKNAIQHSTPVTFVIGNESADLDSICSAILLAYLRTYSPPTPHHKSQIHIPLSNIPHSDLRLRPELSPVLSKANLSLSDILTLSDLPSFSSQSSSSSLSQILKPESTRWLLVDHNALQADLGKLYANRVVGCIDHHEEEGKVPRDTGDEPRIVQKSGSCASLVVEYCREGWERMSSSSSSGSTGSDTQAPDIKTWDAQLAHLALAPILIDTGNLKTVSKVTPADESAVAYLESKITGTENRDYSRDAYYKKVSKAKEDIDHLSVQDILRKDYKQWTEDSSDASADSGNSTSKANTNINLGISSIVKPLSYLLSKSGSQSAFLSEIQEFAQARALSLCAIMTTSTNANGQFQRELLVWGIDERGAEAARRFEKQAAGELELSAWEDGRLDEVEGHERGSWRRAWMQGRLDCSRKQVGPLLRKAIGG